MPVYECVRAAQLFGSQISLVTLRTPFLKVDQITKTVFFFLDFFFFILFVFRSLAPGHGVPLLAAASSRPHVPRVPVVADDPRPYTYTAALVAYFMRDTYLRPLLLYAHPHYAVRCSIMFLEPRDRCTVHRPYCCGVFFMVRRGEYPFIFSLFTIP
jgi:hypothetical protein